MPSAPRPPRIQDAAAGHRHTHAPPRTAVSLSPRGATALLRLAAQKLADDLVEGKGSLDDKIKALVGQGLPQTVQEALDIMRVVGNNAVHPGELDLRDDRETATALFGVLNFIVEDRVARPKQISGLFNLLPQKARDAIAARNAKALPRPEA